VVAWFQRCCERAGLEGIKIHELRHSAGDRLWRETGDLIAAGQVVRKPPLNQAAGAAQCTVMDVMSSSAARTRGSPCAQLDTSLHHLFDRGAQVFDLV
jgi:hypothetical protein